MYSVYLNRFYFSNGQFIKILRNEKLILVKKSLNFANHTLHSFPACHKISRDSKSGFYSELFLINDSNIATGN